MRKLTGLERVLTALKLQEPDVVPHFERVAKKVREGILPGASEEDFVEYMDLDGIRFIDRTHSWSYETVDENKRIKRDQWGGLVRYTTEDNPVPIEPAIKSERDLDTYVLPDPDEEWRYEYLKQRIFWGILATSGPWSKILTSSTGLMIFCSTTSYAI